MPFKLTDTAREMTCYIEEKIERICLQGINKFEFFFVQEKLVVGSTGKTLF